MRNTADLPKTLVRKRAAKEFKRKKKREKLQKVSGKGMHTAGSLRPTFMGLKPKKIEGFVLFLRGVKITEKIWKKIYPEAPYGGRTRMV